MGKETQRKMKNSNNRNVPVIYGYFQDYRVRPWTCYPFAPVGSTETETKLRILITPLISSNSSYPRLKQVESVLK
jgi:hypothetical protein